MSLPQTGEIKYVLWSPDHYPMEQNMYENITATPNLSVEEQARLIAIVQSAPVSEVSDDDGTTRLVYGYTAEAERALSDLIAAFIKPINYYALSGKGILDQDDAASLVMEAFIKSVRTFDLDGNIPFHSVLPANLSWPIKRAERSAAKVITVNSTVAHRYFTLMHRFDNDAVAAYAACRDGKAQVELSAETFLSVHNALNIDSLDYQDGSADNSYDPSKVANNGSSGAAALQGAITEASPEEQVIAELTIKWLFSLVKPREEAVLRVRFGFTDPTTLSLVAAKGLTAGDVQTEAATAEVLGLSTSATGRAYKAGIATMRAAIQAAAAV